MSWDWTSESLARLQRFLAERGILDGSLTTARIGDGHSNLTYSVTDGRRSVIVRRPPPPPIPPGAHDVLREAKLISALAGTGVPVPTVLATADAGDVIDAPFYVMNDVPGVVITDETPDRLANEASRRSIGEALFDRLADLHAVDWRGCGLEEFGRPEGFNRRHLQRIARLVAKPDEAMPAAFAPLYHWLDDNAPSEVGATIVHNDYRLGNVMWGVGEPVRLLAILDWELATIGDPLFDLGYALACYPHPEEAPTPTQKFALAALEPGYPSRDELARRYSERTGYDISGIDWYRAMAEWKLAVLYEYSRIRGEDAYYSDPALVGRFLDSASKIAGIGE